MLNLPAHHLFEPRHGRDANTGAAPKRGLRFILRLGVFPMRTSLDAANQCSADSICRSNLGRGPCIGADSQSVIFRQFGTRMRLGMYLRWAAIVPAFFIHVGNVVLVGAKPQMAWIDTRRVVASMADKHSSGDSPAASFVGKSMSQEAFPPQNERPIPLAVSVFRPIPAAGRKLLNIFVKVVWGVRQMLSKRRGVARAATKSRSRFPTIPRVERSTANLAVQGDVAVSVRMHKAFYYRGGTIANRLILPMMATSSALQH